jgi:hypothetical protein
MPAFVQAKVEAIIDERPGLQKLSVNRGEGSERAYVLVELVGAAAIGDEVILNTSAVDLGLGTGGWHFVHWNLTRNASTTTTGREMKLRYTSLQTPLVAAEQQLGEAPLSLDGTPVVACMLLSQAAAVVTAFKNALPKVRVVLVMTDANALPIAFSDLIFDLKTKSLIDSTITAGQAFGGDHEAVSVLSAMGIAKQVAEPGLIVVTPGPGSLGTGSRLGHSTVSVAATLDDIAWYEGVPILAARWSDADKRSRHKGLSHHTATVLSRAHKAVVAVPNAFGDIEIDNRHDLVGVDEPDIETLLEEHGIEVSTMGRSVGDDLSFFRFAAAAGTHAAALQQAR